MNATLLRRKLDSRLPAVNRPACARESCRLGDSAQIQVVKQEAESISDSKIEAGCEFISRLRFCNLDLIHAAES
jgi:hypothetical protein